MPDESHPARDPRPRDWRRITRRVAAVVAVLVMLWLLQHCREEPPFDYFAAKAEELGRDATRITAYVRGLEELSYRGDLKGALGTLFGEAGSPEEKLALLEALLAHARARVPATLAAVAPDARGPAPERPFEIAVVHLSYLPDGTARETPVFKGPVGALVGDVHSISVPQTERTRLELRARRPLPETDVTVDTAGAVGEAIRFELELPGRASSLVVLRELWRADDRTGPRTSAPGDRHELVVLPCRMRDYVRRQEGVVLAQQGRADAGEMPAYDALLEYALTADALLARVEQRFGVRATFDSPRLLMLTRRASSTGPVTALDLTLDETSFAGGDVAARRLAAATRSLLASAHEHAFLGQWMPLPCASAFELFGRLSSGLARTPGERTAAIAGSLAVLRERGPPSRADFGLRSPAGTAGPILVTAEATDRGLALAGGGLARDVVGEDPRTVALAIEAALVAATSGPLPHARTLDVAIDAGREPLVVDLAQFVHRFDQGGRSVDQHVRVTSTMSGLAYRFRTRAGLAVARGTVEVASEALANAFVHDPVYRHGTERRERATSLVVSRRVHGALVLGETTPFTLLAPHGPKDDPRADRPVAWSGRLVPDGSGRHTALVNGRATELRMLYARPVGDATPPFSRLAILDDARFPLGRADALVRVTTAVRGRLVDLDGIGIAGAIVALPAPNGASVLTWPDGQFRLPPPIAGETHGAVVLTVRQKLGEEEREQDVAADLTAPGLDPVIVRARRLQLDVVWLAPSELARLDALPLSPQVRRHARRALEAGRIVIVPARMVATQTGTAEQEIACYEADVATGEVRGVLEEGIHGVAAIVGGVAAGALELHAPPAYAVPSDRGLAWGFSAERLARFDPAEVHAVLHEILASWEHRTTVFAETPPLTADAALGAVQKTAATPDLASAQVLLRAAHAVALDILDELSRERRP